jgi:tellurite resistance protein TehA-like permease
MSEERDRGRAGGLVFVACMFIGGGIGLALGRPDVGGAVGMGIGFILMAFLRAREEPIEIKMPSSASAYFLILLGIAFVISGIGLIYFPDILHTYIIGIFAILFGLGFLVMAGARLKKGGDGTGTSGTGKCCT